MVRLPIIQCHACIHSLVIIILYIYIGMFYWMLLNIRPAYRSTLHSIQLLPVANEKIINRYGIDAVLKPAVDELKELGSKV